VKLYVDEPGHVALRRQAALVVSSLAAVEVPAAFWRKQRQGELKVADAETLVAAFAVDLAGTERRAPRFAAIPPIAAVLERAAALCATDALRAYDAVQLASAAAAREADRECDRFACFDQSLRSAAARSGFSLIPSTA